MITVMPIVPPKVQELYCGQNYLHSLPVLPDSLRVLSVYGDSLSSLPILPDSLTYLDCGATQLSSLPDLPKGVTTLSCAFDYFLTSLPALPDSLETLMCQYDVNLHCLPKLNRIVTLYFNNTGITCLPNYGNVTTSLPSLNTLPLCTSGNQYGCSTYSGLQEITFANLSLYPNPTKGYIRIDYENYQVHTTLEIYNSFGQLVQQQPLIRNNQDINVNNLDAGLYLLTIRNDNKGIILGRAKFLKE